MVSLTTKWLWLLKSLGQVCWVHKNPLVRPSSVQNAGGTWFAFHNPSQMSEQSSSVFIEDSALRKLAVQSLQCGVQMLP